MRKLGLIGGIGPESTIPYYHDIVYGVQSKVGERFFPNLTIESLNVFDVLSMCERKEYEALINYLMTAINNLRASGAEFIALSGNTPHIVFDELQKRSSIPLVSIIEATCEETKRRDISKVGLIGTIFAMEGEFYKKPFANNHIEVITPNDEEKRFVNEKILQEIELGIVKEETISAFLKIVQRMKDEDGIEAVVLGCTELPFFFKGISMPVDSLDTMQIHIQTLVNMIIED